MPELLCPDDEELLAVIMGDGGPVDVQEHVDGCPECRGRARRLRAEVSTLQQVARMPLRPDAFPASPEVSPAPQRPTAIGKYLVLGSLGVGGQATAYLVYHPTLQREMVIKLGHEAAAGEPERDTLLAEGKVLAQLDHPNLARVYDLDFYNGRPFLVMEYVRGRSLSQYATQERPTARRAAALVAGAARALATAHRRGIIHQDVTPHNILIDEAGNPRVIDFGLARLRQAWGPDGGGPSGGSPPYMSPEQARGEDDKVSQRSDVFGLGAVLYYLLTGRPPFTDTDADAMVARAARCDFDRSALRVTAVPRALARVCLRALAADPKDRHDSAESLAADLERFLHRRQWAIRTVLLTAVLLLAAAGAWGLAGWWGRGGGRGPVSLVVQVFRGGEKSPRRLEAVLPARSGDEFQIEASPPPEYRHCLVLWYSEGKVDLIEVQPADETGPVYAPPLAEGAKRLSGGSGTEFVLVVASRSDSLDVDEVKKLLGDEPLPELPALTVVHLGPDKVSLETITSPVEVGGRPLDPGATPNAVTRVQTRLDELRRKLGGRFDHFEGVAFAHK